MTEPIYIVGDIGGTHARFAHFDGDQPRLRDVQVLMCKSYESPTQAIEDYLGNHGLSRISGCCLAIATRVREGRIKLTNNHWQFDKEQLAAMLKAPVLLINDLAASAYAVKSLPQQEHSWLSDSRPQGEQMKLVLSSGTGLGVAMLTPAGEVLPSEGGHSSFAPHNLHEYQLLHCLMQRYERVSAERVLSGNGLSNLYWAQSSLQQGPVELTPAEIIERAKNAEPLALDVIGDFFSILSSFLGDMALISLAEGGVYLTGGVLDKLWPFYDADRFMARLSNKGRFSDFCTHLPLAKVTAEHIGLVGCAHALKSLKI